MNFDLLRLTILDWAVIALITAVAIQGARAGGASFLLVGRARVLLTLALAPLVLGWIVAQFGGFRQLATSLAVPPGWASYVGMFASVVILFFALGLIGIAMHAFASRSGIGSIINRILGLAAGAFFGVWMSIVLIVAPSVVARDYIRIERQPEALRASIVVPWVNQHLRPHVQKVIAAVSQR